MANIKTTFAGLQINNPLIAASSGLTADLDQCIRLQDHGIGAIVLKSIFEEEIKLLSSSMRSDNETGEGADFLPAYIRGNKLNTYTDHICNLKAKLQVPIIASICCSHPGEWAKFAEVAEKAGADAIELNVMSINTDKNYQYGCYEQELIDIYTSVKDLIKIPVTVKLANNFTNPVRAIKDLYSHGLRSTVLFNRHYRTDIDINNISPKAGDVFSNASDICEPLRWTSICSAAIPQVEYTLSGGVLDGESVVKAILAGASAVQICTALYRKGATCLDEMTSFLHNWMETKGFANIDSFKGKLNAANCNDLNAYERTQFMAAVKDLH